MQAKTRRCAVFFDYDIIETSIKVSILGCRFLRTFYKMKIAGFTFIRNALKYDYPIKEAILSILPICDEFVVAVGDSDDGTLAYIQSIDSPKIRIIESVWDDSLRVGGKVLADETNKAFRAISDDIDWAFYIQGDEVVHEKYLGPIKDAMQTYKDNPHVDGLLFRYLHFYGSYDYVGESYNWYRHEVRVVRNRKGIFSYKDAQGFRKLPDQKLNVKLIDAFIYHYGYVRPPEKMGIKSSSLSKFYHSDEWLEQNRKADGEYNFDSNERLTLFEDSHPAVFQKRIGLKNWQFDKDLSRNHFKLKDRVKYFIESLTGWIPGEYRNYKKI